MSQDKKPIDAEIKQQLYGGEITDHYPKLQDKLPYKNDNEALEDIYSKIQQKQKNILKNKNVMIKKK
jgi:hypothetical protein